MPSVSRVTHARGGFHQVGARRGWTADCAFTDPTGSTTRFTFDELDSATGSGAAGLERQRYRYEASGALASFEDFDGTRLDTSMTRTACHG